jgi:mycoredoxin
VTSLPVPDVLTVYGAPWCGDCLRARLYLDRAGVSYRYIDLQADQHAQALLDAAGLRAIPVIVTADGQVLVEPTEREMAGALGLAS